jgi:hypothetical protein
LLICLFPTDIRKWPSIVTIYLRFPLDWHQIDRERIAIDTLEISL